MDKLSKSKDKLIIEKLVEYINDHSGVNIADKCKNTHYVFSRTVYFKIAFEYISSSLEVIAAGVNRHHATAIHARKLFDEIESIPAYKKMYDDACNYMKFIEGTTLKEHKEIVQSEKTELVKEIEILNRIIVDQNDKLQYQQEVLDEIGLEPHEIRYRKLSEMKKDIFRTRVNAILKMI